MIINVALILYYIAVAAHIVHYVGVEIGNVGNWCGTPVLAAGVGLDLHLLPLVALIYVHKASLRKLQAVVDQTGRIRERIRIENARMWAAKAAFGIVLVTPLLGAMVASRFAK